MKFNASYNRYVSKDGSIYRIKNGILVLCKETHNNCGYVFCSVQSDKRHVLAHRIVYETFNGEIPEGYEIDHINSVRDDNRLCNLQLLTHTENLKKRRNCGRPIGTTGISAGARSAFGKKFFEHYHIVSTENWNLYQREHAYYRRHNNMCRWENT